MARLVCHDSQLKDDGPRLRQCSSSQKMCQECDVGIVESTKYLVMQCSVNEKAKEIMYREICTIDSNFDDRALETPGQVFYWLLGKLIPNMDEEKMV